MFVCVHVCMYLCMYAYLGLSICMFVGKYVCIYVCMCLGMYVGKYRYLCRNMCLFVSLCGLYVLCVCVYKCYVFSHLLSDLLVFSANSETFAFLYILGKPLAKTWHLCCPNQVGSGLGSSEVHISRDYLSLRWNSGYCTRRN